MSTTSEFAFGAAINSNSLESCNQPFSSVAWLLGLKTAKVTPWRTSARLIEIIFLQKPGIYVLVSGEDRFGTHDALSLL